MSFIQVKMNSIINDWKKEAFAQEKATSKRQKDRIYYELMNKKEMIFLQLLILSINKDQDRLKFLNKEHLSPFDAIYTCSNGRKLAIEVKIKQDLSYKNKEFLKDKKYQWQKKWLEQNPNHRPLFICVYPDMSIDIYDHAHPEGRGSINLAINNNGVHQELKGTEKLNFTMPKWTTELSVPKENELDIILQCNCNRQLLDATDKRHLKKYLVNYNLDAYTAASAA